MDTLFSVTGRVALVTGGSQGLGFIYAKALASRGANVIVCDLDAEMLERAVSELQTFGKVSGYTCDVTNEAQIIDLKNRIVENYGHLDILINNAGVVQRVRAEVMEEKEWDRVMDVNLKGTFLCCRHLGVMMKERKAGKIINISSIAGRKGMELRLAYCTSKAAIEHFTRVLASEWGPYNVNVNAIGPGYIKTSMNADMRADQVKSQQMIAQVPLERFGEPEDLIGALLFLTSPASDYVTGQTIFVDGGITSR